MAYIKIDPNGVVVGKSCDEGGGLIEAPNWVICGMVESGGTYILPPKPPAEIKVEKLAAINATRDKALLAGFTHASQIYHTDAVFQGQLQAYMLAWLVGLLAPDATVPVRRKDNTTAMMDKAAVSGLTAALMAHVQGIYAASWLEKDAL